MPFIGIVVALTEPGRKRRLPACSVKMGYIAELQDPETRRSPHPFLRCYSSYAGGSDGGPMPEHHWRYADQMTEQNRPQPEVAEKEERIVAWSHRTVNPAIPLIAPLRKQSVKLPDHLTDLLSYMPLPHHLIVRPVIRIVELRMRRPVLRKPVPDNLQSQITASLPSFCSVGAAVSLARPRGEQKIPSKCIFDRRSDSSSASSQPVFVNVSCS